MSRMKDLLMDILELRMDGMSPEEISEYLKFPLEKVNSALERWLPEFSEDD